MEIGDGGQALRELGRRIGIKGLKNMAILLWGGVIGFAALWAVFLLPTERMEQNVRWSMPMLRSEFENGELIPGFQGTLVGSFTDCLMLHHSIYENSGHTRLEQMLRMYRSESLASEGWQPGRSLSDYIDHIPQPREEEYGRYWHGYLVVLKPLLMLTTVNGIRMISAVAQIMLICLVLILCMKKKATGLAAAFMCSLPFLYVSGMFMSLSLSICFYLMTIAMAVQLSADQWLESRQRYGYFFLAVGMATSYFDFLTYPLVTLAFPLCQYLYLDKSARKERFRRLFGLSADWCVGYAGLWAIKWVIVDVLTGSNVIRDAVETVFERTGGVEDKSGLAGFFYVAGKNLDPYRNIAFAMLCLGICAWLAWRNFESFRRGFRGIRKGAGVFLVLAAYPFVWYFFTQNHSGQHWMFTCKILAISVYALVCAGLYGLPEDSNHVRDDV